MIKVKENPGACGSSIMPAVLHALTSTGGVYTNTTPATTLHAVQISSVSESVSVPRSHHHTCVASTVR